MMSATGGRSSVKNCSEAGEAGAGELSGSSDARTNGQSSLASCAESRKHDQITLSSGGCGERAQNATHIDAGHDARSKKVTSCLCNGKNIPGDSSTLDGESDSDESWLSDDQEIDQFHEFLDELASELKEVDHVERTAETFAGDEIERKVDSCFQVSEDLCTKAEPPSTAASSVRLETPVKEADTEAGCTVSVHIEHDEDSPAAVTIDIHTQTETPSMSSSSEPAGTNSQNRNKLRPWTTKPIGNGTEGEDAAVVVDAYCEKTFWLLDNFLQDMLKLQDHQTAVGCRRQEGNPHSAVTEAKAWMSRLIARYDLPLPDQLMVCNKAIQHTLVAWEKLYECPGTSVTKSDQQLKHAQTPPDTTACEYKPKADTPWSKDGALKSTKALFEGT